MAGTGTAVRWDPDPSPIVDADTSRANLYGGLVGDMIDEIGHRMVAPPVERPAEPDDLIHRLSVASGYLALAFGCVATALGIFRLL